VKTIALTGGIGTGKSTVAGILRERGVTVIDADEAVRAVQAPGTEGLRKLTEAFGEEILTPDRGLDRTRMAAIAFTDAGARRKLEAIIHPLVRLWMAERQREAIERGEQVVVHDIPLLYESRGSAGFDAVLLVYAPEPLQLRRLIELRGMDEQEARARIAAQMPIEEKRRLASHVIVNTGSLSELRERLDQVWTAAAAPE
jgi:dephospho-CoA kinase